MQKGLHSISLIPFVSTLFLTHSVWNIYPFPLLTLSLTYFPLLLPSRYLLLLSLLAFLTSIDIHSQTRNVTYLLEYPPQYLICYLFIFLSFSPSPSYLLFSPFSLSIFRSPCHFHFLTFSNFHIQIVSLVWLVCRFFESPTFSPTCLYSSSIHPVRITYCKLILHYSSFLFLATMKTRIQSY